MQICNPAPGHLAQKLSKNFGLDKIPRTFSPWSNLASLFLAQLSHTIRMNNICATLAIHEKTLNNIRSCISLQRKI